MTIKTTILQDKLNKCIIHNKISNERYTKLKNHTIICFFCYKLSNMANIDKHIKHNKQCLKIQDIDDEKQKKLLKFKNMLFQTRHKIKNDLLND
jgi:hypothetical protein